MMLVERQDELGLLHACLTESRSQVVVISGGLAGGKTELLHAFAGAVGESGALLLSASGARAERGLEMGLLRQLMDSDALTPVCAELAETPVTAEPSDETDELTIGPEAAKVARKVYLAVLALARTRPVVLAVDDIQFADTPSVQVLLYLVRRLRSAPVLMVFTEWAQQTAASSRFRAELNRHPHHHLIRLGKLSENGVAELVAQFFDAGEAARQAPAVHALSGGNPLLVHALIEDHFSGAGERERPGAPAVGTAFRQAVLDCLHRWEPRLIEVARGLALLGSNATPALVGRLIGLSACAVAQVFDILDEAGLLSGGHFRHPAAAEAVLDSLSPSELSRIHRRAAELLYQQGAAAPDVAGHLLAADDAAEPWAVKVLRDGAEQALADDRTELAAQLLKLALRACHEDERLAITMSLATVEWRLNPSAAAMRLAPLRDALFRGELSGDDAITVVRYLLWQGKLEDGTKALAMLHGAGQLVDAQTKAELDLAYHCIYGIWRGPRPEPVAGEPTAGNPWTQAAATLTTMLYRGPSEKVVNSAGQILRSCRLTDTTLEVVVSAVLALTYGGKPDQAAAWCEELLDEAVRRKVLTWQAVLGTVFAEIALRQGDLALAERRARTALGLMAAQSWGVLIGFPLSILLLANTAMGRHDVATELLQQVVPEEMLQTVFGIRYLRARGYDHLENGRALAAFSDFQTCGRLMKQWGLDVPAVIPWRSDLAQAQLRLGRRKEARDLVGEQLERPHGVDSRIRGTSLRVLAATREPQQRPQLLRNAVEQLQVSGDRLELVRALADLSEVYHELGEFGRARTMANRASQEAKACQAELIPARLARGGYQAQEPARTQAAAPAMLSDAELRVASLAAVGQTNREIGRKLFITPSTVEQHLTRVYRKLNVNSRKDLPAGLAPLRFPEIVDEDDRCVGMK